MSKTIITVLGQPADVAPYRALPGYNVAPPGEWAGDAGRAWIAEAVERGDDFLLVSTDFTGAYDQEIRWLQAEAQQLRMAVAVINDRARELTDAVARISTWARAHGGALLPPVERE